MSKMITSNRIGFLIMLYLLYLVFNFFFVALIYNLSNIELTFGFSIGLFAIAGAGIILTSVANLGDMT